MVYDHMTWCFVKRNELNSSNSRSDCVDRRRIELSKETIDLVINFRSAPTRACNSRVESRGNISRVDDSAAPS